MKDVIVIGAGAAGLSAAHEFEKAHLDYMLLEARDRVGGRILSRNAIQSKSCVIELGPEFLHGHTPVTDTYLEKFGLFSYDLIFDYQLFDQKLRPNPGFWRKLTEVFERNPHLKHDLSFQEFLDHHDHHSRAIQKMAASFVEGFDAAKLDEVSALALFEAKEQVADAEERKLRRVLSGYSSLMQAMAQPIFDRIQLNREVKVIRWERNQVLIEGIDRKLQRPFQLKAKRLLVTLPVPFLRRDSSVEWKPRPSGLDHLVEDLRMGSVMKTVVELDPSVLERFEKLGFPFVTSTELHYTAWWGSHPIRWPTITAWAGGKSAERLLNLSSEERLRIWIDEFSRICDFSLTRVQKGIRGVHEHDWSNDPFSKGAYSYPGVRTRAPRKQTSFDDTIFIAGEAFHEKNGTVEGALASGASTARKIVRRSISEVYDEYNDSRQSSSLR